jgi:hypothetical protein
MKQTAVEWLIDQVEDFIGLIPVDIIEQAKAMEKEQIKSAAKIILFNSAGQGDEAAEQYYNETYNK